MVKTYNPKEITLALGSHIVTGFADDSFITIEANGDGITKKVGCDGEVARAINPDATYKMKISLLQTSESNSYLQNRFNYDRDTGEGLFSVLLKDLKGTLVFSADAAWVIKPPSRSFGKDTNNRDWEIDTGDTTLEE